MCCLILLEANIVLFTPLYSFGKSDYSVLLWFGYPAVYKIAEISSSFTSCNISDDVTLMDQYNPVASESYFTVILLLLQQSIITLWWCCCLNSSQTSETFFYHWVKTNEPLSSLWHLRIFSTRLLFYVQQASNSRE